MASKGFMRDSYVGGIGNASFIPDSTGYHPNQLLTEEEPGPKSDVIKRQPASAAWDIFEREKGGNKTDEDKIIQLTCGDDVKVTNINKTEEYNSGYVGLSILPWEDFVFNPRVFNELFFVESNSRITYDPDEVNTFFHGKNVMPPSVGDISENGKSWNIVVHNIPDLKRVRTWLTERCSVFGVTLLYKEKRFQKPERAPCLVMMDPNKGMIGDRIYTTITRAMDSLHNQRRFCVEINLNGCVERWCKRVLMTECEVVGGKLVITNGEEYLAMDEIEDKICCVVCFPIWLLQTGIYKLHRTVVYDDFNVTFDADDLFLHGAFQDARCQRRQIFTAVQDDSVFRTRSAAQTDLKTLQDLGSFKFVCVKKYDKPEEGEPFDENCITRVSEHNTTTFGELVQKRKEKVMTKEKKMKEKGKNKTVKYEGTLNSESIESGEKLKEADSADESVSGNFSKTVLKKIPDTGTISSSSDEENDASLKIPEVASVLCDNDEDSFKEVPDTDREDFSGSLFSPGTHHILVSKESTIRTQSQFSLRDGNIGDDVAQFQNNIIDSSESDSDDSDSGNITDISKCPEKNDLLHEMLKIDQTLPALRNNSVHTSKTVEELKETEKKNSIKKKKGKDKPGVKKALKDLMKTTKGQKEPLPSTTDDRFKAASGKLKLEKKLNSIRKNTPSPDFNDNGKSGSNNNERSTIDGSYSTDTTLSPKSGVHQTESTRQSVKLKDEDGKENCDNDNVVSFISNPIDDTAKSTRGKKDRAFADEVTRVSPEGGNDNTTTLASAFDVSEDSSTDGDDVEMIYQSSRTTSNPSCKKDTTLFLQDEDDFGFIEKVRPNNNETGQTGIETLTALDNDDVDDNALFENGDTVNKPVGEKIKRPSKASKHQARNEMFQKTNKTSTRPKLKNQRPDSLDEHSFKPEVTKSLDLDMEVMDFDQDGETPNDTVVKSMDAGLPAKLTTGQRAGKRPARGTRHNSTRKYLGSAAPPKHAKGK